MFSSDGHCPRLPPEFILAGRVVAMDSIIEIQRQTHEEIEHFERALYSILAKPQQTHEVKLQTEHKSAQILDRISSRVVTLNNFYEDQDARQAELDLLSASSNPNDLSEFYKRLGKIQEHYAKYPEALATGFDLEIAGFLEDGIQNAEDEEWEENDRAYFIAGCQVLSSTLTQPLQPLPSFSPEKSNTENTWICTLIRQHITT